MSPRQPLLDRVVSTNSTRVSYPALFLILVLQLAHVESAARADW